ncbi:hypothetical protein MNBD_NITROSPINAE03-1768 [hydrothermal vent metagenome]|uniref:GGDEF domain-containing protein n=1 Tax=hydrothermal vent metagenome TaxID=652676 RepID=A0A3B1BUI0_9ZZZZ
MPQTYNLEIHSLVRLAGNVTDAFTAALFLVDAQKPGQLVLEAFQSLSNNVIKAATIPIGHGLVGWVAKHERPTIAKNFRHDTTTLQFYSKDEDIKSFAATPIFDQGRLIGVLSVDSKKQYVFTDKQAKILAELGETFARVISTGKKCIHLDKQAADMDVLSEIAEMASRCESVSELTKMARLHSPSLIAHDHMVLAVRSSSDNEYRLLMVSDKGGDILEDKPLPLTHYRLGWVIHQARAIYLPSLDAPVIPGDKKKWGSFIGAPMLTNNVVGGAIGLLSRRKEAYRQSDLKSLNILAAIFASAFDSVCLRKKSVNIKPLDPVTGTIIYRELLKKFDGMERNGAMAIIDLKNFTLVNEEFGLDGGDVALVELARRIESVIGDKGELSRFYGDRFIAVLPGLTRRQAASMLKDVADSIDSAPFHYKGIDAHITPVIGAAICPENGHSAEKLLFQAQRAVNSARNTPGVRVLLCDDPDQPDSPHVKSVQ